MNLRFGKDFQKLEVVEGIIENITENTVVELAISEDLSDIENSEIIVLKTNDKHIINVTGNNNVYARAVNNVVGEVNYLKTDVDGSDLNLTNVYTKTEVDTRLDKKAEISEVYLKTEVDEKVNNKVDKVDGKKLTTEDFTTELKNKLDGIDLSTKVDKVNGKQLSTEDFTTEYKNKLEGIDTNSLQGKTDNSLSTTSKEIVGAINELVTRIAALESRP